MGSVQGQFFVSLKVFIFTVLFHTEITHAFKENVKSLMAALQVNDLIYEEIK